MRTLYIALDGISIEFHVERGIDLSQRIFAQRHFGGDYPTTGQRVGNMVLNDSTTDNIQVSRNLCLNRERMKKGRIKIRRMVRDLRTTRNLPSLTCSVALASYRMIGSMR